MLRIVVMLGCLATLLAPTSASAWGYQGHEVVGSIADKLLKPSARAQVRLILNGADLHDPNSPPDLVARRDLTLQKAAPWADCVKSVVRHDDGKFHYEVDPNHLEYEVPCISLQLRRGEGADGGLRATKLGQLFLCAASGRHPARLPQHVSLRRRRDPAQLL
jgi:S1/P1 Nuclease